MCSTTRKNRLWHYVLALVVAGLPLGMIVPCLCGAPARRVDSVVRWKMTFVSLPLRAVHHAIRQSRAAARKRRVGNHSHGWQKAINLFGNPLPFLSMHLPIRWAP